MLLELEAYYPGVQSIQRLRQNREQTWVCTLIVQWLNPASFGLFLEKCRSRCWWGCHGGWGWTLLGGPCCLQAFFPKWPLDHHEEVTGNAYSDVGSLDPSQAQIVRKFSTWFFLKNLLLRYNLHNVKLIPWACSYRLVHWVSYDWKI